jgi:predicted nucleotidyltransferase
MRRTAEPPGHRAYLLEAASQFTRAAARLHGVQRISLLGSITTDRSSPKDIDLLVNISPDADVAALAEHARRLKGTAQQVDRGADVFLADDRGIYLGRTCHWKVCRPGVRRSCDALHCGHRPHVHDDLHVVCLSPETIHAPPVTLWPAVVRRRVLPEDVEDMLAEFCIRPVSGGPVPRSKP